MHTRLGADHYQRIMPPTGKDCSNTFLERSIIYAASYEWNKLGEHIRILNFDCFRNFFKQCYLNNNMDADCKQQCLYCSYYYYFGLDHC